MLTHLLGHTRVRVMPVLRPYAEIAVDSYEIPEPIRRQVLERDTHEVFPYSSRTARDGDLDHTDPYRPGRKRQTRASNLGSLWRKPHRAKTHAGWDLQQPKPGIFWWSTPNGERYRIGPNGTSRHFTNPRFRRFDEALWKSDHDPGPTTPP